MEIRCNDCYEENELTAKRCRRCGRLLDDARREQTRDAFEIQHHDAPNVVKKNFRVKKVW